MEYDFGNDRRPGTDLINVHKAFSVIAALRSFAKDITTHDEDDFHKQYAYALLFHSLHSIGFADVPISKKIYAMISATTILNWLMANGFL